MADIKRKQKDGVINNLRDLFGNVLHIDIIKSVASQCDFDVQRTSNVLLEMTSKIDEQPKKRIQMKKKSPQHTPPAKKPEQSPRVVKSKKAQELERVIANIRQGFKVLVIMRGLPGSGKSRLAVTITDVTLGPGNNSHHILSTDDFFMQTRGYMYDFNKLQEAHNWNQSRAFQAMSKGLSPVIIDNTNTQMWEMKPYAMMATDYGYIIEIVEPDTWWAFNDKELARRNSHGVPRQKIKDMMERYEKNVTTQKLLCAYSLVYKFQKPPQFRQYPPILNGYQTYRPPHNGVVDGVPRSKSTSAIEQSVESGMEAINLMDFTDIPEEKSNSVDNVWNCDPLDEILMCSVEGNVAEILQPNPVQNHKSQPLPDLENAWGVDEKALQSWDIVTPIQSHFDSPSLVVVNGEEEIKEVRDNSTSVDAGDFLKEGAAVPFGFRVVQTQNRDINVNSPMRNFTPPKKTMIDQSCVTDDVIETDEDEESRIKDLMDLFPRVPRSALQELFNKCHKNFHWTVDLLLDDNNLEVAEAKEVEEEKEKVEVIEIEEEEDKDDKMKDPKVFKRKTISEDSLELKKYLEGKFDISKDHYSEHVYKVKQTKFGAPPDPQPSTSRELNSDDDFDSQSDSEASDDDPKNMIELNLGETFVAQLETMFGGNDGAFPQGYQPVVQMPLTLARQIYSFYVESICQQMEAQNHILDRLVKEDEEFARKLQSQEETAAAPPLNFTEIMDEQVALNLHRKEEGEWRNLTADNLAAKLTKQKLFNAFPNVERDALIEIWHAYDYDYNKTVEDLIASVGAENVNGSRDAIKEPPLSSTTLQEMKEAEERCEAPEEPEERQPATYYREEANKHLRKREELYEKARSYYQRGMTEVALFYSELAKKETRLYDKANHFAAAAFVEEHSKRLQKFDTLDLHYLYVKEAIPNLDLFIDRNINLLKGSAKRGQDLFVITGRGKNSEGGRSKIKPAVIARLKKRRIGFVQLNPGLLKIRVQRDSPITSDIP